MVETRSEIEDIAGKIMRYLLDHPNAADSLEGIVHWWLLRQQIELSEANVKMALDYLVKNNLISRTTTVGGQVVYANIKKRSRVH